MRLSSKSQCHQGLPVVVHVPATPFQALSWDLPAEDEIATTVLSGGASPYTAIVMPREEKRSLRGLYSFGLSSAEGAAEGGNRQNSSTGGGECVVPRPPPTQRRTLSSLLVEGDAVAQQFREWQRSFLAFMKKVGLCSKWHKKVGLCSKWQKTGGDIPVLSLPVKFFLCRSPFGMPFSGRLWPHLRTHNCELKGLDHQIQTMLPSPSHS